MKNGINVFSKVVIWTLIFSPIFQVYGIGSTDFGELITYCLIFVGIVSGRITYKLPKRLNQFFIYFGIVTIASSIYGVGELANRLFGVLHLFLVFLLFFSHFDLDYFYRGYKKVTIFVILLLFVQEISYKLTGIRISCIIPFLPLVSNFASMEGSFTFQEHLSLIERSSSVFSEPALMAQYIIPFLPLSIYKETGRNKYFCSVLCIFALVILKSGIGIIGLALILSFFSIKYLKRFNAVFRWIVLIPLMAIFIVGVYYYVGSTEGGQKYTERTAEIRDVSGAGDNSSGFYRIYRGYFVYAEYNTIEKLTGINNFSGIKNKIRQSVVSYTFEDNDMYFNTIQSFLLKTGIIGLFLFFLFLKDLYKRNDSSSKVIILTLTLFSFTASMFLSDIMLMYLLVPFSMKVQMNNKFIR